MLPQVPKEALGFGFMNEPVGTHGSHTIMLKELRRLLSACPRSTDYEGFLTAIVEEYVLLGNTVTTRKESFRRLREMYALDESTILFRALRDLWDDDPGTQPLLALPCATAQDSILRGTAETILAIPKGESANPHAIEKATEESFPGRYNPTVLASVGRHAASSWQQSGHLQGRIGKVRERARATPAATAHPLLRAHLCGNGSAMSCTRWIPSMLKCPSTTRNDVGRGSGYYHQNHCTGHLLLSKDDIQSQHLELECSGCTIKGRREMHVEGTQVAAATVTTLAPFLPILLEAAKFSAEAIGEMIVQKGGEAAWKKAKAAWAEIKGQYGDDGVVIGAATMVAAQPEDQNLQQILAIELAKRLNESPELTKALLDLLGGEKSVQKVLANRSSWVENVTQRMTGGAKQIVSATDDSFITGVQQIKR